MNDRIFYPLAALIAVGLIALALVWPRGLGAGSPARAPALPAAPSHQP